MGRCRPGPETATAARRADPPGRGGRPGRAEGWFDRHGGPAVLIGRVVPVVRSLVSVPAGVERMPLLRFIVYTTVGSGVYNMVLIGLGYVLSSRWQTVEQYPNYLNYATYAAILVAVGAVRVQAGPPPASQLTSPAAGHATPDGRLQERVLYSVRITGQPTCPGRPRLCGPVADQTRGRPSWPAAESPASSSPGRPGTGEEACGGCGLTARRHSPLVGTRPRWLLHAVSGTGCRWLVLAATLVTPRGRRVRLHPRRPPARLRV